MESNQPLSPVFLALPTHDGRLDARTANAAYGCATKMRDIFAVSESCSLLAHGFNQLYCKALNMRVEHQIKWFAMLHSDIAPEPYWLDKLISIAELHGADLLSAVVPIKSADGITSTAVTDINGENVWKRLTQTEIHSLGFPKIFALSDLPFEEAKEKYGSRKLLVNTGCMILRLDQLWSDEIYFTITDGIERRLNQYVPTVESEDWFLSRLVANKGGKVMATSEIALLHIGPTPYSSKAVWGKPVDPLSQQ